MEQECRNLCLYHFISLPYFFSQRFHGQNQEESVVSSGFLCFWTLLSQSFIHLFAWLSQLLIHTKLTNSWFPGGDDDWGLQKGHVHTAMFRVDNQWNPIIQHMELSSVLCTILDGRGDGGEWIHVYVWLSPFTVHVSL